MDRSKRPYRTPAIHSNSLVMIPVALVLLSPMLRTTCMAFVNNNNNNNNHHNSPSVRFSSSSSSSNIHTCRAAATRNYELELELHNRYADSLGPRRDESSSSPSRSTTSTRSTTRTIPAPTTNGPQQGRPLRESTNAHKNARRQNQTTNGHTSYQELLRSMRHDDVSTRESGGALVAASAHPMDDATERAEPPIRHPYQSTTRTRTRSPSRGAPRRDNGGTTTTTSSPLVPYGNYGHGDVYHYYSPWPCYYGGGDGSSTSHYYGTYGNHNFEHEFLPGPNFSARVDRPGRYDNGIHGGTSNSSGRQGNPQDKPYKPYGRVVSAIPRSMRTRQRYYYTNDYHDYGMAGTSTGTLDRYYASTFNNNNNSRMGRIAATTTSRQRRTLLEIWERTAMPLSVQGGSLKTWSCSDNREVGQILQVLVKTPQGRPLNAIVELWQGSGHTPQSIRVYMEDGGLRTLALGVMSPQRGSHTSTISVRNIGSMELPIDASAQPDQGQGVSVGLDELNNHRYHPEPIQGGSVKTFSLDPDVESVSVLLQSENGRPLSARVELLTGPNNEAQMMDMYSEEGLELPFYTVIDTPGHQNAIRIVNTGTIEFPISVRVAPFSARYRR